MSLESPASCHLWAPFQAPQRDSFVFSAPACARLGRDKLGAAFRVLSSRESKYFPRVVRSEIWPRVRRKGAVRHSGIQRAEPGALSSSATSKRSLTLPSHPATDGEGAGQLPWVSLQLPQERGLPEGRRTVLPGDKAQ